MAAFNALGLRGIGLALVLLASGCGGGDASGGGDGGSGSSGSSSCGSYAAGSYKCDYTGSTAYFICRDGDWWIAGGCNCTVKVGDPRKPPYYSTCKYHSTGAIECSYAGTICMLCEPGRGCH